MPDLRHARRDSTQKPYLLAAGVTVASGDWVAWTEERYVVPVDHEDAFKFLGEALADASNANGEDGDEAVVVRTRGERLSLQDGSLTQPLDGVIATPITRDTVAAFDEDLGGMVYLHYSSDGVNYAYVAWNTVHP